MLVSNLLTRNVNIWPDKEAMVFGDKRLTYSQTNERVNRLANALLDMGVEKGDRVAIVAHNCCEYVELYFAVAKIGAIAVAIDFRFKSEELLYALNYTEPKVLLIYKEYLAKIEPVISQIKSIAEFVCIDGENAGMREYEDVLSRYTAAEPPDMKIEEDDTVAILFSSGTTGIPKGVMHTHRVWCSTATNAVITLHVGPEDIVAITTPLFHGAAIWPLFSHFYMGGKSVIMRWFDAETLLELVQRERITGFNSVPTIVERIAHHPELDKYDLSSIRWWTYGAAPMPVELLNEVRERFGDIFGQIYGSTEGFISCYLHPHEHTGKRIKSCGRQFINCEVKVVDDNDREVKPGEIGHIKARGDFVMKGYWQMPEETATVLRDGWQHSEDLATVDEDGYIYIVDRARDMLIRGGENIFPKEIEEVIYAHPAVREVAVIGIPDELWGEEVKAFVALREDREASEQEIIDFCKSRLSSFKCPKSVEFRESLPKTATGKITKVPLREKYWGGRERRV